MTKGEDWSLPPSCRHSSNEPQNTYLHFPFRPLFTLHEHYDQQTFHKRKPLSLMTAFSMIIFGLMASQKLKVHFDDGVKLNLTNMYAVSDANEEWIEHFKSHLKKNRHSTKWKPGSSWCANASQSHQDCVRYTIIDSPSVYNNVEYSSPVWIKSKPT